MFVQCLNYTKLSTIIMYNFPDCQALLDAGYTEDGVYTIHPFQKGEGTDVFCDMRKHTGWIVSRTHSIRIVLSRILKLCLVEIRYRKVCGNNL